MFEKPIKGDLDRAISLLTHEGHQKLLQQCNDIKSQAIKAGALHGSRVIVIIADAANSIHQDSMKQAASILLNFIERMQQEPAIIVDWARPHLDNLANVLLGCIPPNGFPVDHQRIRQQYLHEFQQRLNGVLRDVQIGFAKGVGFAHSSQVEIKKEWISATEAIQLLNPIMKEYSAQKTICARAHAGLIRTRAERFMIDNKVADGHELPKDFWWAEGEAALQQNWATGDFATWIEHRVQWRAFGVTFSREDIDKIIPAVPAKVPTGGSAEKRSAVILTALSVESLAVLRHLSEVHEKTQSGTVFHVGSFREWRVALAECGEGNANAAAIVERGISKFNPEVALFVGVAGGVKDVSIGDALVSSKIYGYERGKDTSDGFKTRPQVQLSAHSLEQRARAINLRDDWRRRLNSDLPHSNPRIFIGPIAAGEKVIASSAATIALFLKEHYSDTLGVEMEGHGFLAGVHLSESVRGCVVRGISDLLDGKADADRAGSQERAADVASAVAFEMLATLPRAVAELEPSNSQEPSLEMRYERTTKEGRTHVIRTYFAPELARIAARQIYILRRATANFVTTSVGRIPSPADTWASLKPWQPLLYPNSAEFRNLPIKEAGLLVNFYDSLQEITDIVSSYIDNCAVTDFNAWNVLMQKVQNNLRIGQRAIKEFCPETQYDETVPGAGTLLSQSDEALSGAQAALAAHLSRQGV